MVSDKFGIVSIIFLRIIQPLYFFYGNYYYASILEKRKGKIKYSLIISQCCTSNEYDDLILTSEQEEQLEEAGIDTFDFECMDDDEKMEALEEAGLDPYDFDMY